MDAGGAQAGVGGQRVADERQIRVESAGPIEAATDASRGLLHRGADRLTVETELGRDGPDLPVLAVVQTPDLGALRGCDHRRSPSDGRRVRASESATGSTARRPRNGWPWAPEPGRGPRQRVCSMGGGWRNPDPSRDGGRRAAGRGGRGALRGCADAALGRPAPSGGGSALGTTACSRHGRGHTPRRWRTGGCSVGRSSGGAQCPRCRSAQGGLRLDIEPESWHKSTGRLALSEHGAVTRVRWPYRALTPPLSPLPTLRERVASRQPHGGCGRRHSCGRKQPRPQEFAKPRRRGFAQRPQPSSSSASRPRRNKTTRQVRRQASRIDHFLVLPDSGPRRAGMDRRQPRTCDAPSP